MGSVHLLLSEEDRIQLKRHHPRYLLRLELHPHHRSSSILLCDCALPLAVTRHTWAKLCLTGTGDISSISSIRRRTQPCPHINPRDLLIMVFRDGSPLVGLVLPNVYRRTCCFTPLPVYNVISSSFFHRLEPASNIPPFTLGRRQWFLIRKYKRSLPLRMDAPIHIGPFSCSPAPVLALSRHCNERNFDSVEVSPFTWLQCLYCVFGSTIVRGRSRLNFSFNLAAKV